MADAADSDEALLAATARGDARAFATLAERHSQRVLAFAQSVLGNPVEAEDVAQEVFVKLWQQAPRWQAGRARVSTWLFRVTRNAALNYRSRVRGREAPASDDLPELPDDLLDPASTQLERDEERAQLQLALAALPEAQRSAMALVYLEGLRQREAADAMEISLKALEALLVRARRRLRAMLAPAPGAALGGGAAAPPEGSRL